MLSSCQILDVLMCWLVGFANGCVWHVKQRGSPAFPRQLESYVLCSLGCYVYRKWKWDLWPGAVPHACNPSTLGGWGGQIIWGQEFETSLANMVKPISIKNTKIISQVCWHEPVIPATGEAEAGELLESWRWRLQWAKIVPLHSSLGDSVRLHLKKNCR